MTLGIPIARKSREKDDKFFVDRMKDELDEVFIWGFLGLQRLIINGYEFTQSDKSKKLLDEARRNAVNIIDFLDDQQWIMFDKDGEIASVVLYNAYEEWCHDNSMDKPLAQKTMTIWLNNNKEKYGMRKSNHVMYGGKQVNGFKGIRLSDKQKHARHNEKVVDFPF